MTGLSVLTFLLLVTAVRWGLRRRARAPRPPVGPPTRIADLDAAMRDTFADPIVQEATHREFSALMGEMRWEEGFTPGMDHLDTRLVAAVGDAPGSARYGETAEYLEFPVPGAPAFARMDVRLTKHVLPLEPFAEGEIEFPPPGVDVGQVRRDILAALDRASGIERAPRAEPQPDGHP